MEGNVFVLMFPHTPDVIFGVLFVVVLGGIAGLSVTILLNPSVFFRWFPNPMMPDTPLNRLEIRPVGLVFLLFVVMVLSSGSKSSLVERFHENVLIALYSALFLCPIICLILWRFGRRKYDRWDRRVSVTFATIFLLTITAALLLAIAGHHA